MKKLKCKLKPKKVKIDPSKIKRGHQFGRPGKGRSTSFKDKRKLARTAEKVKQKKSIDS